MSTQMAMLLMPVGDWLDSVRTLYTTTKPGSRTFLVPRSWSK